MDIGSYGKVIDKIEVKISYRIIELFSAGLYSSPNKAFEELICNSYDAFADTVSVYVPSDLTVSGASIWVCDNGEGLSPSELKDLWKIGESSKRNSDRDKRRLQIGQFGIGKLSTYILARKLTYVSKKNKRFILATMDFDLIYEGKESLTIDEREISEAEAKKMLKQLTNVDGQNLVHFKMFGPQALETWTMSILTDLRPKASEITLGRLKWILSTALPLNPAFNMFLNNEKIESSKINIPIMKEWIIGKDDQTADSLKYAECRSENDKYYIDFEHLKGVNGTITLYENSLVDSSKSSLMGRSHGIFLIIRGRLINLDDPLLGMEAFSHGAFNRTRIVINADQLDSNLTSTREAVKESRPFEQLKDYIKKKFNNEIRKYYFEQEQKIENEKSVSYRLARTSYNTSKRPIYSFIKRFYSNEIINPILIKKPVNITEAELLTKYDKDIEAGTQVIETIEWDVLDIGSPIAKLNLATKTLTINAIHPYIANYSDAYKSTLPLESIAITEVLTEAYLYELEIDETTINAIMRKRDNTLRQLALSDREGIPAVAQLLHDSVANPMGLEDAVYRAFLALGFEASKIGGKGKPDGIAEAILGYTEEQRPANYSLTYDAKSTEKNRIAAGTAKLSALKRHQSDLKANYAVEVAIGFQGEDDPDSAISKEAREQKVTLIKVRDLVRLLLLAAPKQLGLGKLRGLFETCYAPMEVTQWIDRLDSEQVVKGPYYVIVDIVYDLQKTDSEPPNTSVVRYKLNQKLKCELSTSQVTAYIETLKGIVPGFVSLENEKVGVQASPEVIKAAINRSINTNVPIQMQSIYKAIFG